MAKRPELLETPEGFDYLPPVAGALAASSLAEMAMHVVARSALLNILVGEDPDVDALFREWTEGTAAGQAASRLVEMADAAASAAGFPGGPDLIQALIAATDGRVVLPATPADAADEARITQAVQGYVDESAELFDALFAGLPGIANAHLVEDAVALVRDRWRLPWPWLAFELFRGWLLWLQHAPLGQRVTIRTIVEVDEWGAPAPEIAFATRPGETVGEAAERAVVEICWPLHRAALSGALPAGRRVDSAVVERNTRWWYRARIRGESIRSIGDKDEGQRKVVAHGVGQAERLLGIVNRTWRDEAA